MYSLTKEMAELYGIILGDGCISSYYSNNRKRIEIRIDGNSLTDVEYYDYLQKLIYKITKKEIKIKYRKNVNGIFLRFMNKELTNFFHNELNFPLGKKGNITINSQIISKEIFLIQTLRGFFDTDGSIYFTKNNSKIRSYPIIELSTHSPLLIQQLKEILEKMGFKPVISFYGDSVKLHGKKNVIKWMQEIGSSNPYKNGRFEIWLKKGYF